MLAMNKRGLDLIKKFEGCRLEAYQCSAGKWTIGYGHTGSDVKPGMKITQERAEELLSKDIESFEMGVLQVIDVALTENQFAALVCFAYNVGVAALGRSNLLKKVNQGLDPSEEFLKWVYGGGKVLPGLVKRREAERDLYNTA